MKEPKTTSSILIADKFIFTRGVTYARRLVGVISDRFALSFLNYVLPLSILFDNIFIPPETFDDFSEPFLRDLRECIGALAIPESDLAAAKQHANYLNESELFDIFMSHSQTLYALSGSFAGDFDDLVPAMNSITTVVSLSEMLACPISTGSEYRKLYQDIAKQKSIIVDKESNVLESVISAYNMPTISLDTFRDSERKINLDLLFATMKTLRDSKYLNEFREKIGSVLNKTENPEEAIPQEIIRDFRELFQYCFSASGGEKADIALGVISDCVGLLVPGTSTAKAIYAAWKKRQIKQKLSWHLFMWEYQEHLQRLSKSK